MTDMPPTTPTLRNLLPKAPRSKESGASIEDFLFSEPFNATRAEQAIWRAVLVQMLTDALSRSRKRETRRLKREALDWLSGKSRDFRIVCDYAGYDPSYLHGKVMQLLAIHQVKALPVPLKRTPPKLPPAAKATGEQPAPQRFSLSLPRIQTRLSSGINLKLVKEDSE